MANIKESLLLISVALVLINILAHFLPLERSSLGSDDYALLVRAKTLSLTDVFSLAVKQADRPLGFAVLMIKEKLLNGEAARGLLLILIMTSLVLLSVSFLLRALLGDTLLATLGAIIFCLVPYKLEVYHLPIFAYIDLANLLSVLSFVLLVCYARKPRSYTLILSLLSYTATILIYEAGFLIPVIFAVYLYLFRRERVGAALWFAIPAGAYLTFKFTGAFGNAEQIILPYREPSLAMVPANLLDLIQHYAGRYMARNVLYGAYQFLSVEKAWLATIILSNLAFLVGLAWWVENKKLPRLDARLWPLAMAIFVFSTLPVLFNSAGGIGGRHLVLPSIAVSVFAIGLLEKAREFWRGLMLASLAVALIVSQGNAWAQVVACRINAAVYETLKERQVELARAKRVIIDTKSFADKIPFTWVQRDFNVLNTYYGAQAFEDWGLKSMVTLATGGTGKPVYIATESPRVIGQGLLEFAVSDYRGYRSVSKRVEVVPRDGTMIIDFKSVFGEQFNNGVRTVSR